ncbi:PilC/PilY family type IV pilus protein [Aquabacterium sp.]|uniref:pilus assembly protein n=1 Tax=Aquabacterium sp. TaxID=1872578 RepID=UPI002487FD0F|nr:PilC/PilY family type IV pilus protein [Aquabacterium sp.]MDI1260062.1 PilC/PilY family type IV pilus protein [Aquabacterium sp.]
MNKPTSSRAQTWLLAAWLTVSGLLLGAPTQVMAATTSIANEPLATMSTTSTKPNILFVLDNSGSMGWDYMPDDVNTAASSYTTTYGYKSAQCNGVAYDPTFTYSPPLKADGSSFPNASFSAANPNGFGPTLSGGTAYYSGSNVTTGTGSKSFEFTSGFLAGLFNGFNFLGGLPPWSVGDVITAVDANDENHWVIGTVTNVANAGICLFSCTRTITINVTSYNGTDSAADWKVNELQVDNLANSTYYRYTGAQTKMGWTYTTSGVSNTTFKNECISHPGNPAGEAGDGKFTGVVVTAGSSEAQNYANWYQYYRTRMLMTRTAAGRAFQPLTNRYRVGFSTINNTGITESNTLSTISAGNAFLNVRDYDSAQRSLFMERLYNATPNGGTPLRTALSKAGRYFAKKVSGQTYDPMQYACQRSYAFLSTDGYWNDGSNPKQLNGTTDIGQQDGADVRPFSDGATSTSQTVSTVSEQRQTNTAVTVAQKYTYEGYTYSVGSCFSPASGCSCFSPVKKTTTALAVTPSVSGTRVQLQDFVTTTTVTTTTTAGVQSSSTAVTGPAGSSTTTTDPSPSAPALASWPTTSGYASATSSSCISTGASRPASNGGPYASGPATATATSSPTTVVLGTTTGGPTTTVTGGSGGSSNTLADVAQYYYMTDLRTSALANCTGALGTDVCDNSLLTVSGRDTATWQHMTTFTLGLGVNGALTYDRYYLDHATDPTSSYYKLLAGSLLWPAPVSGSVTTVDDLWHAAVNGRGQYFGANNATDLTVALSGALAGMGKTPGAGAALAISSAKPSGNDNLAFATSYTTVDWTGDMVAYTVASNGTISTTPLAGSAQAGVDNLALRGANATDRRNIYYRKPGTTTLVAFNSTNLTTDGLNTNFTNFCSKSVSDSVTIYPQQCTALSAGQLTLANNGTNLVNWLRGVNTYEESNAANPLFRGRVSALGDIINSEPVYLAAPPFGYIDAGYAAFKTAKALRRAVVYVGGNDGMLHAFSGERADMGVELWAFVPTAVMPKLGRLANADYGNYHQYSVDGSPIVGDIVVGSTWKSILVGGFNAGGKGYYALDITNPASPSVLWEFTQGAASVTATDAKDPDLGLTYGDPIITKRADGTWVVVFASGYNNTGNGYLYVLNANTGVQLAKIPTYTSGTTPAGTVGTPSGLARINAWIDSPSNNTASRFYGGDLLGNLWRFDIDNVVAPNGKAQRLASFLVGSSAAAPQPITTRPELSYVKYGTVKYPMVFVATGRYLGTPDLSDATQQAIYAIKDPLTASDWGDVRANGAVVQQTVITTGSVRTASTNAVNLSAAGVAGWRVDLPTSKERVAINMKADYGILVAYSVIPGTSSCTASGETGWRYIFDQKTGSAVSGLGGIGSYLGSTSGVGGLIAIVDGRIKIGGRNRDGSITWDDIKDEDKVPGGGGFKRAAWRELINN